MALQHASEPLTPRAWFEMAAWLFAGEQPGRTVIVPVDERMVPRCGPDTYGIVIDAEASTPAQVEHALETLGSAIVASVGAHGFLAATYRDSAHPDDADVGAFKAWLTSPLPGDVRVLDWLIICRVPAIEFAAGGGREGWAFAGVSLVNVLANETAASIEGAS